MNCQTKPKYKIERDFQGERTLWLVKLTRNGKVLSHHADSSEAHATAQRYVAEDRDNCFAMEG